MAKKPNIILFITHDQGQFLGCYDSPQTPNSLRTPNLDSLAEEGVRFVNHFCCAPQCSPSRGGIQTSKYPHQNGLMGLVNRGWTLPESNKTIPMFLRDNGYITHLIGFQHEVRDVKTLGYDTVSKRVFEHKYSCQTLESEYFKFLMNHRNDDKPFFLCIGTPEVHRPFVIFGKPVNPSRVKVPPYLPDNIKVRKDLAEFYGSIEAVDGVIGRILRCLEVTGLKDDTLFVYTTDHGEAFPRAKCTLYDPGIKTLLLMSWPQSDLFKGGKTIESLTNNIDLLPTLLDLVGAERPDNIEGVSILPVLSGVKKEIHEEIYTELTYHEIYNPIRCVRNQKFKYIRNFEASDTLYQLPKDIYGDYSGKVMKKRYKGTRPMEEFYDLENDPTEKINAIEDLEHTAIISEMKGKLDEWMRRTDDPLLKGRVLPQRSVIERRKNIEMFEHIYLPFLSLIQKVLRIKCVNKKGRKLLSYIP